MPQQQQDWFMKTLIEQTRGILLSKETDKTMQKAKQVALALWIILLTAHDTLHQNVFVDYFMWIDVHDALLNVLVKDTSSVKMQKNACICMTLLSFYRRFEQVNIYVNHMQDKWEPSICAAIAQNISKVLALWNKSVMDTVVEASTQALLPSIFSLWFSPTKQTKKQETSWLGSLFNSNANEKNEPTKYVHLIVVTL